MEETDNKPVPEGHSSMYAFLKKLISPVLRTVEPAAICVKQASDKHKLEGSENETASDCSS